MIPAIPQHKIGNKVFVGSLFWQSLTKKSNFRGEAQEQAKKNTCDLYMIREATGVAQAGLAYTKEGFQAGMYSFAAAFAKRIAETGVMVDGSHIFPHNWLAAIELEEDKWAFVAVRDEAIMANGDKFGSRDEIINLLEQTYGYGAWNAVIGSAGLVEYQYPKFVELSVQDIFPLDRRGCTKVPSTLALKPFKLTVSKGLLVKALSGVLALGVAAGGYWKWDAEQKRIAQERAMEEMRQLEAQKLRLAAATQKLPHPWATMPQPYDMAGACESGFLNVAPGGWITKEVQCSAAGINLILERGLSTIGQLKNAEPAARIDAAGDVASVVRGVKFYELKDEELGKLGDLSDQVVDYFQRLGIKVAIAPQPDPVPQQQLPGTNPLSPQDVPPKPDWRTSVVSLGPTGFSPSVVLAGLAIPGFRFERITYKDGEWTYEGKLYAR